MLSTVNLCGFGTVVILLTFCTLYFLDYPLDVARPDKISGADINAICQEVRMCISATCMYG